MIPSTNITLPQMDMLAEKDKMEVKSTQSLKSIGTVRLIDRKYFKLFIMGFYCRSFRYHLYVHTTIVPTKVEIMFYSLIRSRNEKPASTD